MLYSQTYPLLYNQAFSCVCQAEFPWHQPFNMLDHTFLYPMILIAFIMGNKGGIGGEGCEGCSGEGAIVLHYEQCSRSLYPLIESRGK